jgi:hypothetical protein
MLNAYHVMAITIKLKTINDIQSDTFSLTQNYLLWSTLMHVFESFSMGATSLFLMEESEYLIYIDIVRILLSFKRN